ncbi:TrlF family AAA-like ATPase [Mycobacteroides salmoniphilum]|uniref:TrlF family AAA-like ATPase n=1 Tax=Mycobacteroides salmoniphilum TaxID=404941 RepID=UPI001F3A1463|nr:AAA family ATPase [Mycobacteroides salmoniphilum]
MTGTAEAEQLPNPPRPTQDARHAGARWWSLDIHTHSPASFDYGGVEGRASDTPRPSFKDWVRAYIDAGVDGIAVTDHNSHLGIDQARTALEELRREDPELPQFVIFPGVEITASGGTHILGIFDPTREAEVVNQVLVLCEYKGTRGHSDETANKTVADVASIIQDHGGICIPAHADKPRGVFKMDSREYTALAASDCITAVEVIDDAEISTADRLGWVSVLGSDAHHLTTDGCPEGQDAKAPGTHLTLIKAETLELEGIRLALTDPIESVRRCWRGYSDPNNAKHGHINSVRVSRGEATEAYRFSPWMNCLIGGRGVGKSTIIEILRLALGRSHELAGSVADDLNRFLPYADASERWWDEQTQIVVEYTKDDRLLRITWSGAEPDKPVLELREGDMWEKQSGLPVDRAPIRVFSQKQIYDLATSPQSFLAILDDMPAIRKIEWSEEYEQLRLEFKGERNKLRQLLAETEKADRMRGELEEVQGRLRHLAKLRATAQYKELTSTEACIKDVAHAERHALSIEEDLATQASTLRGLLTDALRAPEYTDRASSFITAANLLEQASTALQTARKSWAAHDAGSAWQERLEQLNVWLTDQGNAPNSSSDQTQKDRQRESELLAGLRDLENCEQRQQEQQAKIDHLVAQLLAKRRDLFTRRRDYTQELGSTSTLTRVDIHHQGDIANVGDDLRTLLNCPDSFETAFSSDGIAASLLGGQPKNPNFPTDVQSFKEALIELIERGAESDIGRSFKVDGRFFSRLSNADAFDLATDIMLWFPEDLVSVLYRPVKGGNLTPVDHGSPGQKTAALLTVILQMGSDPLLLDQPEDDLENKLIRRLAVETLKNIKTGRQIVVSTHNANIVVTSAAENILVLQHGEDLPRVEVEGTLQRDGVKKNVCEILEGGEDAIRTRYRRLIGTPTGDRRS